MSRFITYNKQNTVPNLLWVWIEWISTSQANATCLDMEMVGMSNDIEMSFTAVVLVLL